MLRLTGPNRPRENATPGTIGLKHHIFVLPGPAGVCLALTMPGTCLACDPSLPHRPAKQMTLIGERLMNSAFGSGSAARA